MAEQAKVSSFDALETFRADLIVFLTKARRSADGVRDEVRATRQWITHDRRLHWEGEIKRWRRTLDQAEGDLMNARMSTLRDNISAQQRAVLKAKRALADAEEKLRRVKRWNRDFDSAADPLTRRVEGLREFLDHDLPKAVGYLAQALTTLDAYAEATASPETPPPPNSTVDTDSVSNS